jgi:hypothetical protein
MKYYSLLSLFLLLGVFACSKDTAEGNEIADSLVKHFAKFEEEAANRGIEISTADLDLDGYIANIQSNGVVGQCNIYQDGNSSITIDRYYWITSTELQQEYVVFHELGHCVLLRDHRNDSDVSGSCISMMQSGEGFCEENYTTDTRNEHLDELFTY